MESSWRITNWKLDSASRRRNSSSTMGCGERMQTFSNLELTVALTIVAKASGIGAQGQERWRSGFHTRHGCVRPAFRCAPGEVLPRTPMESSMPTTPNAIAGLDLAVRTEG